MRSRLRRCRLPPRSPEASMSCSTYTVRSTSLGGNPSTLPLLRRREGCECGGGGARGVTDSGQQQETWRLRRVGSNCRCGVTGGADGPKGCSRAAGRQPT
jgi:hypothetical protein